MIFCVNKLFFSLCLVAWDGQVMVAYRQEQDAEPASAPALITGCIAGLGVVVCLCMSRPEHKLRCCSLGGITLSLFLIYL